MSKEFSRISIEHLASWILREYRRNSRLRYSKTCFSPKADDPFTLTRYGQHLEACSALARTPRWPRT
ncbi:hypothetical protein MASR1M12_24350 [Erysipelotrichia bacterium]